MNEKNGTMSREELSVGCRGEKKKRTRCCPSDGRERGIGDRYGKEWRRWKRGNKNGVTLLLYTSGEKK